MVHDATRSFVAKTQFDHFGKDQGQWTSTCDRVDLSLVHLLRGISRQPACFQTSPAIFDFVRERSARRSKDFVFMDGRMSGRTCRPPSRKTLAARMKFDKRLVACYRHQQISQRRSRSTRFWCDRPLALSLRCSLGALPICLDW